jgi:photosystem II stability/assembly factor-like uncharacterized protein
VRLPSAKIYEVTFSKSSPVGLYAATSEGLFESADEGKHWLQVNGIGSGKAVYKVAFHPSDNQWITALSADGILLSQDQGKIWERCNLQIGDYQFLDIALVSTSPVQIMAATSRGLFTSRDGGKNWELSNGELENIPINQIIAAPSDPSELYLFSRRYSQLFHSIDYGKTWNRFDSRGLETIRPLGILVSPVESGKYFALSENQGIFQYVPEPQEGSFLLRKDIVPGHQ